jgi:hypothetical protein
MRDNNSNEITKFGKQIISNEMTVGKPVTAKELGLNEDLLYNDSAKGISLLMRIILGLKDNSNFKNRIII